jgi:hypothetical protein
MATSAASAATAAIALNTPTPAPLSSTPPTKPAKPKREKQVYYNIVGEPVDTDEEATEFPPKKIRRHWPVFSERGRPHRRSIIPTSARSTRLTISTAKRSLPWSISMV